MDRRVPPPTSFFQFRLRSLFILMTVVAVLLWLAPFLVDDDIFFILFSALIFLGLSTAILGVVYLRGAARAFWLGYAVCDLQVKIVGVFIANEIFRSRSDWEELLLIGCYCFILPALTGGIGWYVYRVGEKQRQHAEATDITDG